MSFVPEGTTENVESVQFNFYTTEEVKKCGTRQIVVPELLDNLGRPVPGGLYDPELGPLDEASCVKCGQSSHQCQGHFGRIDLASPVYNPLLFKILFGLLRITCFHCYHFRANKKQIERCVSKLKLIIEGDVVGASNIAASKEGNRDSDENASHMQTHNPRRCWTSLQSIEAASIIYDIMKTRKNSKCERCGATSPTLTNPTADWIKMNLPDSAGRSNFIKKTKQKHKQSDGSEHESSINEEEFSVVTEVAEDANLGLLGKVYDGTPDSKMKKKRSTTSNFLSQKLFSGPLLPMEAQQLIKLLWKNETPLCSFLCDIQQERFHISGKKSGYSMFFIESLLVPPIKFRPPSKGGDLVREHDQTMLLRKILLSDNSLRNAYIEKAQASKIVDYWKDLQSSVHYLFYGNKGSAAMYTGICQTIEKKEGIFRQNMMGKRVNHACRSVISPDPYLAVNEIGIPPHFATRLTYPERVTPLNVRTLATAIINGSNKHPGATHYADKVSMIKLPPITKKRKSISKKLHSSRGVGTQAGEIIDNDLEEKFVYRHIQDGDIVLVNRQPTLHKPGIMAHVVRVLPGEKTLRMHYANCSTYNADFDGDEMNVHFPQDEISRAEALNIVNANNQYVVPTSGDPKRGLIQDHIVGAVLLTKKDTFLTRDEYNHLIYSSGVSSAARSLSTAKSGQKVSTINFEDEIQPAFPAILKPEPLWTGKQVITTLLNHICRTRGLAPLTVEKQGKIKSEYFGSKSGEDKMLIQKNEFVHGVIDKSQFDKFGLVHAVQEFYSSDIAGILLSMLSRLFTLFLQMHGFTCGVDDLLMAPILDIKMREKLRSCDELGTKKHMAFVGCKDNSIDSIGLQREIEKTICINGESAIARLDGVMTSMLNELTNEVTQQLFPAGLLKPFPKNCLSLMTSSGAKGSDVNFIQISCSLGQQELEGKRVPRMVSGKTLPCFPPWDSAARAGGFISDRFLTGLRPQEYYFHCMAGREGLVDTAVKTSRSGYLQRCLVKNLEGLKVCYDYTVRDVDNSIIQFYYGEDGVDVHKKSFISSQDKKTKGVTSEFNTLYANLERLGDHYRGAEFANGYIKELPEALKRNAEDFISELSKKWRSSNRKTLEKKNFFMKLMTLKYLSSLAQPGEPVGVIAAQSIGEPSTQMTLNTFHHAGRGDMNVTLGIPRLQEILMRASENIQFPVMTCPLLKGKTEDDANRLAATLKKVTVADVVENMEVRVVNFDVQGGIVSTIYKLKMRLFHPDLYPDYSDITLEKIEEVLEYKFVRELEDVVQSHITMLSKISGIEESTRNSQFGSGEGEEDNVINNSRQVEDENEEIGGRESDNEGEDGADAEKRKRQSANDMDYEDHDERENTNNDGVSAGESDVDEVVDVNEVDGDDDQPVDVDPLNIRRLPTKNSSSRAAKKQEKRKKVVKVAPQMKKKNYDRAVYVHADGLEFEVHLKLTNEPHILLSQIAQKAAKNVYIKGSGTINQCSVKVVKRNETVEALLLQTAGVHFKSFFKMQEDLNINKMFTNDIHAMLHTYGVEAARATIISEVESLFGAYGVSVDNRHLTLVADFMTHSGGYRPMSRAGIADSISPFGKMSFETATSFIVDSAYHGKVDNLESPSARICLGLPVKMGTGSFDVLLNYNDL